jgi:hypothetical protein
MSHLFTPASPLAADEKRKDGKYAQQTLWYKVLNPTYTQKNGRQEFFQRQ